VGACVASCRALLDSTGPWAAMVGAAPGGQPPAAPGAPGPAAGALRDAAAREAAAALGSLLPLVEWACSSLAGAPRADGGAPAPDALPAPAAALLGALSDLAGGALGPVPRLSPGGDLGPGMLLTGREMCGEMVARVALTTPGCVDAVLSLCRLPAGGAAAPADLAGRLMGARVPARAWGALAAVAGGPRAGGLSGVATRETAPWLLALAAAHLDVLFDADVLPVLDVLAQLAAPVLLDPDMARACAEILGADVPGEAPAGGSAHPYVPALAGPQPAAPPPHAACADAVLRRVAGAVHGALLSASKRSVALVTRALRCVLQAPLFEDPRLDGLHAAGGAMRGAVDALLELSRRTPRVARLTALRLCRIWAAAPRGAVPYLGHARFLLLFSTPERPDGDGVTEGVYRPPPDAGAPGAGGGAGGGGGRAVPDPGGDPDMSAAREWASTDHAARAAALCMAEEWARAAAAAPEPAPAGRARDAALAARLLLGVLALDSAGDPELSAVGYKVHGLTHRLKVRLFQAVCVLCNCAASGAAVAAAAAAAEGDLARADAHLAGLSRSPTAAFAEMEAERASRNRTTVGRRGPTGARRRLRGEAGGAGAAGYTAREALEASSPAGLAAALDAAVRRTEQPGVRRLAEMALCRTLCAHEGAAEEFLAPRLGDYSGRGEAGEGAVSYVVVAGQLLLHGSAGGGGDAAAWLPRLLPRLVPWATVHQQGLRSMAHCIIHEVLRAYPRGHPAWDAVPGGAGQEILARLFDLVSDNADLAKVVGYVRPSMGAFDPRAWYGVRDVLRASDSAPGHRKEHQRDFRGDGADGVGAAGSPGQAPQLAFEGCPETLLDRIVAFLRDVRKGDRAAAAEGERERERERQRAAAERERRDAGGAPGAGGADGAGEAGPPGGGEVVYQRKITPEDHKGRLGTLEVEAAMGHDGPALLGAVAGPTAGEAARGVWGGDEGGARRREEGIVVVASLVDKVPNLAGLARTCEIFRAERLVVGDLECTRDPEFESISVTAEKHLPMQEVPPADLVPWLESMRLRGYALLGLEQTATSRTLVGFPFPRKCVLVLGREREGIDPGVLEVLDATVEIPQLGLLRSLNVHVSGAICVYEYVRSGAEGARGD